MISIVSAFMLVAWVLFPLVMLAVCVGCGLLVEALTGRPLSGRILPGLGLVLIIVVAVVETRSATLAPLTTWVIVALALAGFILGRHRLRGMRPDAWSVALALLVYLVYGAPIIASGPMSYFVSWPCLTGPWLAC